MIAVGHQPLLSCLAGYLLFQEDGTSYLSIELSKAQEHTKKEKINILKIFDIFIRTDLDESIRQRKIQ